MDTCIQYRYGFKLHCREIIHLQKLIITIDSEDTQCWDQRRRGWVGKGVRAPPSVGNSGNFRKFQNFISTAHVRDDIMGFECIHSLEKY